MTEYWKSKDRWYCMYCKIYIADDKPSRTHHESGFRHKGNVDRYVRDLYKKGEIDKREKADEAREIAAINAAAQAAVGTSEPPAPIRKPTAPKAVLSSDPFANYSDAQSLGYIDEDAQRAVEEAEQRRQEGRVGSWTSVARPVASTSQLARQEIEDDPDDPRRLATKSFKEKTKGLGDGDLYDPSASIRLKTKKRPLVAPVKNETEVETQMRDREQSSSTALKGFKTAIDRSNVVDQPQAFVLPVKEEDTNEIGTNDQQEASEAPTMFKKRKVQSKEGSSGRRKIAG